MPYTEQELEAIANMLNGYIDAQDEQVLGVVHLAGNIQEISNQVNSFAVEIHEGISDHAELINVLNVAKARMIAKANEIITLLS